MVESKYIPAIFTAIVSVVILTLSREVSAARFEVVHSIGGAGPAAIFVNGDVEVGDTNEFLNVALGVSDAIVVLSSDGGDLLEGLSLAKAIRKLGYPTAVFEGSRCLSACALVWIAGQRRLLSPNAILGFHAAYNSTGVVGGGNAMVGAFYGQLGLSDRVIHYLTSASPNSFNFVTLETADALGIEVQAWLPETGGRQTSQTRKTKKMFDVFMKQDFFGVDIGKWFNSNSYGECSQICEEISQCVAFSFAHRLSRCFLKSEVSSVVWNKNIDSGALRESLERAAFRKISIHTASKLSGEDLAAKFANNIHDCIIACDQDAACTGFNYSKKSCTLKRGNLRRLKGTGTTAGVRTKD